LSPAVTDVVTAPSGLVAVIEANTPFWGAEAEVCRTYFEWPRRSAATDAQWLVRQAAKELVDGVAVRVRAVARALDEGAAAGRPEDLVRMTEGLHEEATHYLAFVGAYERLGLDGLPPLDAATLTAACDWPENVALRELRAEHRRRHGELGAHAGLFTEGGYCTLFSEGMRLAGRGGADDAIARACALVHDDEFEHMLDGIAGFRELDLRAEEWDVLVTLTVEQSRQRIRMRQAQFGEPVTPDRVDELLAGRGEPVAFDWARARLARHASHGGARPAPLGT
jgi:hypothetical protein